MRMLCRSGMRLALQTVTFLWILLLATAVLVDSAQATSASRSKTPGQVPGQQQSLEQKGHTALTPSPIATTTSATTAGQRNPFTTSSPLPRSINLRNLFLYLSAMVLAAILLGGAVIFITWRRKVLVKSNTFSKGNPFVQAQKDRNSGVRLAESFKIPGKATQVLAMALPSSKKPPVRHQNSITSASSFFSLDSKQFQSSLEDEEFDVLADLVIQSELLEKATATKDHDLMLSDQERSESRAFCDQPNDRFNMLKVEKMETPPSPPSDPVSADDTASTLSATFQSCQTGSQCPSQDPTSFEIAGIGVPSSDITWSECSSANNTLLSASGTFGAPSCTSSPKYVSFVTDYDEE